MKPPKHTLIKPIPACLFFILFYLYIHLRIHPSLIDLQQDTLFLFDSGFIRRFLIYPGGLSEYASLFLSQFFVKSWIGALIITILAVLLFLLTDRLIKETLRLEHTFLLPFFSPLLILMLHSSYRHTLTADLGLLLTLFLFLLFLRLAKKTNTLHLLLCLILSALLHWISGGHFLLFLLLCILFECFNTERSVKARCIGVILYLLFAVIIPVMSRTFVFMITYRHAFLYSLPFSRDYKPRIASYILYLLLPLLMILGQIPWQKIFHKAAKPSDKKAIQPDTLWKTLQLIVFLALVVTVTMISFNKKNHLILKYYQYTQSGNWEKIIELRKRCPVEDERIAFFTNRALYHSGKLADNMFFFPQNWGKDGLFLPREYNYRWPKLKSDLFLELGHINESQHYAHEEISLTGEGPRTLQRLAITHILKRDRQGAEMALEKLGKTIFYKQWSEKLRPALDDYTFIIAHPELKHLYDCMPDSDFIAVTQDPSIDVANLLSSNNRNRMAFEYLMASCLLEADLKRFVEQIHLLKTLHYTAIPNHYQEALLMYMIITGKREMNLPYRLRGSVLESYQELEKILKKYKGDKLAARRELEIRHKNTYWYYLMFMNPKNNTGQS